MTTKRARKTLDIDPALLDDVRIRLGVRTERETVTRALEQMQRQLQMADLIHDFHGIGPFDVKRIEDWDTLVRPRYECLHGHRERREV